MGKTVELLNDSEFKLVFGGKHFKEGLAFVRSLKDRLFNSSGKYWTVPISPEAIQRLKQDRWLFVEGAYEVAHGPIKSAVVDLTPKIIGKAPIDRSLLNVQLREYQVEAVQQLVWLKGRGILSFPPGCGKTAVAASYCRIDFDAKPVLIVCPGFMKPHWKRELLKWGGLGSYVCSGRKPKSPSRKCPAWIINYDILQYWEERLLLQNFKIVVIDECQMAANEKAIRTQSLVHVCKNVPHIIPVSGTPIKNRPKEFFTILHLLDPKTFPNRWRYLNRWCGPSYGYAGLEFNGSSNEEELHALISGLMIRKEKEELLPELPPKVRYIIPMELSSPQAYKSAEEEITLLVKQNKKKEAHDALMELSNTAFPLKKDEVFSWIDDWLEKHEGESLVIMAFHHAVLDYIHEKYGKDSILIDGRIPSEKRQRLVDAFQKGKYRILIGQLQAAGIGFTMTKASTMVIAEVCYVPSDLEQVEGRIERLTQKADKIEIYYLIGEDTIEDKMLDAIEVKTSWLSKILDGKDSTFFKDAR